MMGYKIEYSDGQSILTVHRVRKKKRSLMIVLGIVLSLLLIRPVREGVFRSLVPGDEDVTIRAVQDMVRSIQAGEPLGTVLEMFCTEVIVEGA